MPAPNEPPDDLLTRSLSLSDLPDGQRSLLLLARAQDGDDAALAELIERYQDRLRRIVRIQLAGSPLRRDFDSMDFVQGTFQAALPKIGELRPSGAASLLNWLALIATNRIRDAYAWKTAQARDMGREVALDALASASRSSALPPDAGASPEQRAMMNEVRALLDDEVARLSDDHRRVVVLRDYCGEGWERIADELGRDVGAAKQLHQRAWIELRRALRPKLEGRGMSTKPDERRGAR
ncbi:MAG: sigma-70 family RNA polymerase sigma factor [Planctomycetes bacterium]|nr:sigma-70 family RNA polymerase sigma factor [Planctomycetota bacterium]